MPAITKEDRDLAGAARKRAGSVTALAQRFGVKIQTASGWGRRHPIPRHLRAEIRGYVGDVEQPSQDEVPTLREDDMSREIWQALLKVRKVLTEKGVPGYVQRGLKDAIDSAAREADVVMSKRRGKGA